MIQGLTNDPQLQHAFEIAFGHPILGPNGLLRLRVDIRLNALPVEDVKLEFGTDVHSASGVLKPLLVQGEDIPLLLGPSFDWSIAPFCSRWIGRGQGIITPPGSCQFPHFLSFST